FQSGFLAISWISDGHQRFLLLISVSLTPADCNELLLPEGGGILSDLTTRGAARRTVLRIWAEPEVSLIHGDLWRHSVSLAASLWFLRVEAGQFQNRTRWPKALRTDVDSCMVCFREWDRGRERRRDYDRGRRERFSPPRHISPQHKRMRRDWDDHREDPFRYDLPYGGGAPFPGAGPQGWHPDFPHLHPHPGVHPLQGRLGMMDPDLPPPGPPTMRSFKVRKMSPSGLKDAR
ncbi:hypothetical protein XENOCAPTIV_011776, partial [Xenoophorus captivus]